MKNTGTPQPRSRGQDGLGGRARSRPSGSGGRSPWRDKHGRRQDAAQPVEGPQAAGRGAGGAWADAKDGRPPGTSRIAGIAKAGRTGGNPSPAPHSKPSDAATAQDDAPGPVSGRGALVRGRRDTHIRVMTETSDTTPEPVHPEPATPMRQPPEAEIGGPKEHDPTRYGDWTVKGRCIDF